MRARFLVLASAALTALFAVISSLDGPTLVDDHARSQANTDRGVVDGQARLRVEARANTFKSFAQDTPTVVIDHDGAMVVAWQSRRQDQGQNGIRLQRFAADGTRRGPEATVALTTTGSQARPALALAGSRLWAAWQAQGIDGDSDAVVARAIDPAGPEIMVNETARGMQCFPQLAALDDDRIAVAWLGPDARATQHAWLRILNSDGTPHTDELLVSGALASAHSLALTSLGDRCVVAFAGVKRGGRSAGVHARCFAATGSPASGAFRLDHDDHAGIEPSLTALPGGGFAAAWHVPNVDRDGHDVWARAFDGNGVATAPAQRVATAGDDYLSGADLAAADARRVCVAWTRAATDGGSVVEARWLDFVTGALEPVWQPLASRQAQQLPAADGRPNLVIGAQGQLAFAWSGDASLGDAAGVHLTLLLPDERLPGDLNGDQRIDAADFAALWRGSRGECLDPRAVAAADLDRDGRTTAVDLGRFPAAIAAKQRAAAERSANAFAAAVAARRAQLARPPLVKDADQLPAQVTEVAQPHDPPVWSPHQQGGPGGGPDFSGPDFGFTGHTTGLVPPDPHLAVGPTHLVTMVNSSLKIFTKSGTETFSQVFAGPTGFWGALGASGLTFDPECAFDPYANRFVVMASEQGPASRSYFCFAVSDDSDPNGTWHKYRVDVTTLGGGGDIDSPNLGIDQTAYYLTADFFTGGQKYLVYILDKIPLLSGQPVGTTRSLLITGTQSFGIPVMTTAGNAMYLIEHFEATSNVTVRLHAITAPLTTPQHTTFTLTVPAYRRPGSAVQQGTSSLLTLFDARFWSCTFRNNSLWAAHHHGTPAVARWYEIDVSQWPGTGSPTLVQSGEVGGGTLWCYFNALGVDAAGNALMTFARSATNEYISLTRCYRLAGDPPGTMRPMVKIKTNTGPYTNFGRWGDYADVEIDPTDGNKVWYHHEHAPATNTWNTWVAARSLTDWLTADSNTVSASTGGQVQFALEAPPGSAGDSYVMLGTFAGTSPGIMLGSIQVPINLDGWTATILTNLSAPLFSNFVGQLDANGCATAALNVPPVPSLQGATMDYAFATWLGGVWKFGSNSVSILFTM